MSAAERLAQAEAALALITEVRALRARLAAVEALADEWERTEAYRCILAYQSAVIRLRRAALAATTDTTKEN